MAASKKKSTRSRGAAAKPARPEKKRPTAKKPATTARKKEPEARPRTAVGAAKALVRAVGKALPGASKPAAATRPAAKAGKEATPPAPARPSEARGRRGKARSPGPPRTVEVTAGSSAASRLGTKWNCFRCGAKFYDLNKPEPLCPKCGADQRERPKVSPTAAPAPAPRRPPRPMAPLLDDEDDGTVRYEEEFDLGVRAEPDEMEEDLFPPGEVEEEEVFEEE